MENDICKENVVMNIGMTTKDGVKLDVNSAIDRIGAETDCTITHSVASTTEKKKIV